MLTMDLTVLENKLSEARKRTLELGRDVERCKKRARKAARTEEKRLDSLLHEWGTNQQGQQEPAIPPELHGHIEVLVVLLELSGFCVDLVVSWVLGQGNPKKRQGSRFEVWDAEVRHAISAGVEWVYILAPLQVVVSAMSNCDPRLLYELSRFVIEYRLWHWLVKQNCEIGCAPKSSQIFDEVFRFANSQLATLLPVALQEELNSFFQESNRAARYWLVSFRTRWDVKQGKLNVGEDEPPQQLQNKESWLS